ncbi:protein RER1 isoform X2 [Parasteatoda tepidariorum]|uniref:protein RER1 isoform X2 n=1 Tax=Parasteatoda tepidariorum TaxID=114398 RepID=UPI00077FD80C|nr:protein RER1 isoform X2 [Parasteatoda tepidariorum]
MMESDDSVRPRPSVFACTTHRISQVYQHILDVWTPYTISRWVGSFVLLVSFLARVFLLQGWYIITYALGIYQLNLFLAFLSPKIDPAMADDDGPSLPTKNNEEFKPFMRRLPEFKFWYSTTKATLVALLCTFFQMFNIPVFWPILLLYFLTLFGITMKRQIKHMIKYRYLPWTRGKTKYRGKEDSGKVILTK